MMMKFLKPLDDATKQLCATRYPTLNIVIPIYVVVIHELQGFCLRFFLHLPKDRYTDLICTHHAIQVHHTYNVGQHMPATDNMIEKLQNYLIAASEKPGPVCSTILDPCIQLEF